MADTVSKLYAEIGFKVNQDGLKQAQKIIQDMATQMKAISDATKEAAKQYGIFSKDQNKQAAADAKRAIDDEKAENQRNKRKLDNKKFEHKQLMDLAKLEFQVEKYNAAEKAQAERRQARESEKAAKEQQKRLKNILGGFRSFAVGLRNTFLGLTGVGGLGITAGIAQSVGRSIPTRNFLMSTGVELGQLQQVMQRMVNTGSALSQQQVMADIQKVSQNLRDIAFGGGDLVPYKLAGVAATGKVMDVIESTEQAVKDLDNATALNLTRRMGLSDEWLAMWRFKERYGGDQVQLSKEQQDEIVEANIAVKQLAYSFKLLSDQITAIVSPVIKNIVDLMRDSFQSLARYLKTHTDEFREKLSELSKKITNFIRDLSCEKIKTYFSEVGDWFRNLWETLKSGDFRKAIQEFSAIMHKVASFLGIKIEDRPEKKYKPSSVGKAVTAYIAPTTQSMVSGFVGTPTRSAVFSAVDNHVNNITINGVAQEEIAEKAKEAVEEANKKEETILQQKLYGAADLCVVAPTIVG